MEKKLILLLLVLAVLDVPSASAQENTAILYGTVYDWFTLQPMEGAVVEITTTPKQRIMTTDGFYSFEVPPGEYTVVAYYPAEGAVLYRDEENVRIVSAGEYRLDLILFPALEGYDLPPENEIFSEPVMASEIWAALIVLAGVVVAAFGTAVYALKRRPPPPPPERKVVGLPSDLAELIELIRRNGGRMNQRDLRKLLPYSEAKVSLMLADLESRGLVRKIKRGRGNIVVLTAIE